MRPSRWALVLLAGGLLVCTGCDPPPLTDSGVMVVFGGQGFGPGSFSYPRAIAAEPEGSIFVIDKNGRVQRFSPDGTFETQWRMPETRFGKPVGLTVHPDGRLFVADTHNYRVMIFDRDGGILSSFGREGTGDGEFMLTTDVAFDRAGNIYVGEYNENDRVTRWSPDGEFMGVVVDGVVAGEPLRRPAGLVIDDEQTLWIADACNHRLIRTTLHGEVLLTVGEFGDQPGQMRFPFDLSLAPDGTILVCEYQGNRLQWFSKEGESVRVWGTTGRRPGELSAPWGATYGPRGRVYVVDSLNSRIQVVRP